MLSKKPSSRELFVGRVGVQIADPEFGSLVDWDPWDDNPAAKAAFEKLCSDDRLEGVWSLAAGLPDDDLAGLVYDLRVAWGAGDLHLGAVKELREIITSHDDCKTALVQLRKSVERIRRSEMVPPELSHFRYVDRYLDWIERFLDYETTGAREDLEVFRESATQKVGDLRYTEFVGLAVAAMKDYFEQPHYELVAAMVAVFFDKEVDKDVVRSAARKFRARRAA